jgi:phosphoenolpyruvate carboxylase
MLCSIHPAAEDDWIEDDSGTLARFLLLLCWASESPSRPELNDQLSPPGLLVVNDDLLRRDIRLLEGVLERVLVELAGRETFDLLTSIRRLAQDRRAGLQDAERALAERIEGLDADAATSVVQALSIYFDLVNIAEDRQRVRVLRDREREKSPQPIGESLGAGILELKAIGMTAGDVQLVLDRLSVELVFTAHPSEAKRRSIRAKLRRMRRSLARLDDQALLPRERAEITSDLRSELAILWQSEFLRPTRPTVLDEVDRGLSIMPRLWQAVPEVCGSLRRGLEAAYPGEQFTLPPFLTFGSWMGGDRDGNPFVTAEVTERTLLRLRSAAITTHLEWCDALHDMLTITMRSAAGAAPLLSRLEALRTEWPELAAVDDGPAPQEVYRRWLRMIRLRLEASRVDALTDAFQPLAYASQEAFEADVAAVVSCLEQDHGLSVDAPARRWLDLVRTFGLHMTAVDIRQDARRYEEILGDLLAAAGRLPGPAGYATLTPQARQELLRDSLPEGPTPVACELPTESLDPLTLDTLKLFDLLARAVARFGPRCIGGAITSLTRSPADVLAVLWLWKQAVARAAHRGEPVPATDIAIVPLFEKIHDLAHADETLAAILDEPAYARHLAKRGQRQMIMVGYSDSTKDGGYLAACWGLQSAQRRLHDVAEARGVSLTFFHGRGGSLGRGGGPAARGILSLPAKTLDGSLRLTEQGEVLAERYDDAAIASRHLEQVTWATLVATSVRRVEPDPAWTGLCGRMSQRSWEVYRELVDQPGFIDYFSQTTPIDDIENLPIASRPSRRRGERSLDDLRAIPWVFAWTQSRCMIPAWYGLGTALVEVKYDDRRDWQTVCDMYRLWPFFQATIDNATLALAKADMYIAQRYSELAADAAIRRPIWQRIAAERDRARQAILDIVGGGELLAATPWFQRSIEARNPSIDPLNLIQIEFMRRRASGDTSPETGELLRLCVQGIAAGMRTTG